MRVGRVQQLCQETGRLQGSEHSDERSSGAWWWWGRWAWEDYDYEDDDDVCDIGDT